MSEELDGDLKATIDDVESHARQLAALEAEKARLEPADPRLLELSHKAERLARRLVRTTAAERELAEEAATAD